ncbi:MAG: EF-P 5-aminopentanol modification-associated protein YfmH [Eubacteriales bacterium]
MKSDPVHPFPPVEEFCHPSGLQIKLCRMNTFMTWVKLKVGFGAIDRHYRTENGEVILPSGVAHFLEHKLFEDSEGRDISERFADLSAEVNAYTTDEETVFEFSCSDRVTDALELLLDFVTHPRFTGNSVVSERPIIAEEIRMYRNSPDCRLSKMLFRGLYRFHPSRDDIGGRISDLRRITQGLLYSVHRTFYHLSNMALCIAGNVTMEEVLRVCDRLPVTNEVPGIIRIDPMEPPEIFRKRQTAHMDLTLPLCGVGIKDDPLPKGEAGLIRRASDELLEKLLLEEDSPLSLSLYEKGISESLPISMLTQSGRIGNLLYTAKCKNPKLFFDRVTDYLDKICGSEFPTGRLDRIKRATLGRQIMAADSPELICELLTDAALGGRDYLGVSEAMTHLTKDQLQHELHRLLRPDRMTFATLLPLK